MTLVVQLMRNLKSIGKKKKSSKADPPEKISGGSLRTQPKPVNCAGFTVTMQNQSGISVTKETSVSCGLHPSL